jgi:hypothetical protein
MKFAMPIWPNGGKLKLWGSKAPRRAVATDKVGKQTQLDQRVASLAGVVILRAY